MEPERMDLGPLDVAEDQLAYERLIRRVMDAAAPELARRARATSPLALVAGWARPTLSAAAIIAVLSAGALLATDRGIDRTAAAPDGSESAVDALGIPDPAADWLQDEREPSASDLVLAMERRR